MPRARFETDPSPRDTHLLLISSLGRLRWQEITGYGKRALVETAMGRYKALIGERLRCRRDAARRTEAVVGCCRLAPQPQGSLAGFYVPVRPRRGSQLHARRRKAQLRASFGDPSVNRGRHGAELVDLGSVHQRHALEELSRLGAVQCQQALPHRPQQRIRSLGIHLDPGKQQRTDHRADGQHGVALFPREECRAGVNGFGRGGVSSGGVG